MQKAKTLVVVTLLVFSSFTLISFINNPPAQAWYNTDWSYSKKITVDHTKVAGDLVNFTVLIQDTSSDYAIAQIDGGDFFFMDSMNTTKYSHEIESFDKTTGTLIAWVKIPSLSSSTDAILYMYYGNPSCVNQWDNANTWDNNTVYVLHMKDYTTTSVKDSKNSYTGTKAGANEPIQTTSGKIGYGQSFDSANDNIDMTAKLIPLGAKTISAWVKVNGGTDLRGIFDQSDFSTVKYGSILYFNTDHSLHFKIARVLSGNPIFDCYTSTAYDDNTWRHITASWDGTTGSNTAKIYVDGSPRANATAAQTETTAASHNDMVGNRANTEDLGLNGIMDEFKVSNIQRSVEWTLTEYNNQNNPSTFSTIGTQTQGATFTRSWWSDWLYSRKITIDYTKVNGTSNLQNFTFLFSTTNTDFKKAQYDADDIVFTTSDNLTQCNHEIEKWDPTTGELVAWVQVPSISYTANTILYMYYGNPTCVNQQNVVNTWDSNYILVNHMNGNSYTNILDSTSNDNDVSGMTGTVTFQQTGKAGYGITFTPSNYLTYSTFVRNTCPITVECWSKPTAFNAGNYFLSNGVESSGRGFTMDYDGGTGKHYVQASNYTSGKYVGINSGTSSSGTWYYHAISWTGATADNGAIYVQSTKTSVAPGTVSVSGDYILCIGINSKSRNYGFTGTIDEIRISKTARSDGWLGTTYNTQNSPSTFYSLGSERSSPKTWYDTAWKYYKKITVDHTKVESNLTNFPILISTTDLDLTKAQSDGDDFIFISSDNTTKYNHEIEKWDSGTGELIAWINITSLSSTVDTVFYVYYGNPSCSNQQNVDGTWNGNYQLVYHLDEVSGNAIDSTINGRDGTIAGGTTRGAAGKIGKAFSFDGDSDYVDFADFTLSTSYSAETWVYFTTMDKNHGIAFLFYNTAVSIYSLGLADYTGNTFYVAVDGNIYTSDASTTGTWYYVVATYDSSTKSEKVYVNGILKYNVTASTSYDAVAKYIGYPNINCLNGRVDEIRVCDIALPNGWANTSYLNQNSPSTFLSFDYEQGIWYDSDWTHRKKITIDHNKLDATQNYFPVLVKTTMNTSATQSDGDDILFTSYNGTKLNHEIEMYNSTSGELTAWVNVTQVNSVSPDTIIYLYYGNLMCSNQENIEGTWNAGYIMVQHLNEASGTVYDSTSNNKDGTPTSVTQNVTGKVGKANQFAGSGYITLPLDIGSVYTIGLWVKATSAATTSVFGGNTNKYAGNIIIATGTGYQLQACSHSSNSFQSTGANTVYANHWYYFNYVVNYKYNEVFLNGTSKSSSNQANNPQTDTTHFLGKRASEYYFTGLIDEVRVSNIQRPASYIKAEYKTMSDPANFTIVGSEEYYEAPAGPENQPPNTPTGLGPTTRQTSTSVNIYATGSDPDGGSLYLYFYNDADDVEIGHTSISNNTQGGVSWSGLTRGNTYTFYARAYDGTNWSANSSTCQFTVNSLPVCTGFMTENLTDPRIGTLVPYFNWTYSDADSDTQVKYEIDVGTTNNSNNSWASGAVTSSLSHAIYAGSTLSRGPVYYVRVRVYDGYEWSSW